MARFVFIVLDGAGVGALPDAPDYGDTGADTLGNLSRVVDLRLPFLEKLGLGNILPLMGVPPTRRPLGLPGRLMPLSAGKDTTVGHWEHMGLVTPQPFPTYPDGFPEEILVPFRQRVGRQVLGNMPASGTAIIAELGDRHLASGEPIVYTSADSVFQIAAHVDVIPLELLYEWCRIARDLLKGRHAVARVIARPFAGASGSFYRTKDRRDFSLAPPGPTYLDLLFDASIPVLALGKISEIFVDRGITATVKVASNADNLALLLDLLLRRPREIEFGEGLLLTNLVDFDMVWGHRNDVDGFARGLEAVDRALPAIVGALGPEDGLLITADHGVDPTTPSTDHSREYAPLLLYPRPDEAPHAVYEGMFGDTGATAYDHLARRQGEYPVTARTDPRRPESAGTSIYRLDPRRGWRRYTPARPAPTAAGLCLPGRVGPEEAREASSWLHAHLGDAPQAAIILGSGHDLPGLTVLGPPIPYRDIPHWRQGAVPGHAHNLVTGEWNGCRLVVLAGRIHGYEGFDPSEQELPVSSLAAWGLRHVVVVSAAGAVDANLHVGDVVAASDILDFQSMSPDGAPLKSAAAGQDLVSALAERASRTHGLALGVHAVVPGPQYETPAELVVLRALGVTTVSMSGAAETRAARERHLETAMLAVITNVGETSHDEVLLNTALAGQALASAVSLVFSSWELVSPAH